MANNNRRRHKIGGVERWIFSSAEWENVNGLVISEVSIHSYTFRAKL